MNSTAESFLEKMQQERIETLKTYIKSSLDLISQYWKIIQIEMGKETPSLFINLPDELENIKVAHAKYQINLDIPRIVRYLHEIVENSSEESARRFLKDQMEKMNITYFTENDFIIIGK
ncbi:MAG: hypothetical protein H6772_01870 [Pseudomonadales bacterium]|nr:hypothetical protein [Pseudomonadales bacterium]